MSKYDFKDVIKRANAAYDEANQMNRVYQLATQMTLPNQDSFCTKKDAGHSTTIQNLKQLYVNVGVLSAKEFMSYALKYFKTIETDKIGMRLRNKKIKLEENKQLSQIINGLSDLVNQMISDSNINDTSEKLVSNLLLGEAPLSYYYDRREGMKFISIPLDQVALAESTDNTRREFYRHSEPSYRELPGLWPELIGVKKIDDVEITKDTIDKTIKITESVVYNYDTGKWDYIVSTEKSILIERMGYPVQPINSIPWITKSGSAYGTGQAVLVLAELLSMNRTEFLTQYGFAIRSAPVWVADDHAALDPRKLRIAPNAINFKPKESSISALIPGDMPNMVIDWLSGKKMEIQKGMSDNTLLGVGKNASATEIQARTQLMNRAEIFLYNRAVKFYEWVVDCIMYECYRNKIIDENIITWDEYKSEIEIYINGLQPMDQSTLNKSQSALGYYLQIDPTGNMAKIALNLPRIFGSVNKAMRLPTGWANTEEVIAQNYNALLAAQREATVQEIQKRQTETDTAELDNQQKQQEIENA